jgi:hypothetical protein
MPSGPEDLFLPIADNRFPIMLILLVKGVSLILLIEFADYYVRNWIEARNKGLESSRFLMHMWWACH